MELYWFRIDATFQPYNTTNSNSVPSLKQHILFRNYDDFYDFQVNLFNTFPREAGTVHAGASSATGRRGHSISTGGSGHKLCELNHPRAKYILEHDVVREFLALKPGDVENEVDARVDEIEVLYGYNPYNNGRDKDYESEMRDTLSNMMISGRDDEERSEGSDYEDDSYAPPPQSGEPPSHRPSESQSGLSLRQQAHAQNHHRTGSVPSSHPAGAGRGNSPYRHQASASQAESSFPGHSSSPSRSYSPSGRTPLEDSGTSYSPTSQHSKMSSMTQSSRSRSQSNATSNLNNPPISAGNSQTAFVKIKVFDRVTDDLIAL